MSEVTDATISHSLLQPNPGHFQASTTSSANSCVPHISWNSKGKT